MDENSDDAVWMLHRTLLPIQYMKITSTLSSFSRCAVSGHPYRRVTAVSRVCGGFVPSSHCDTSRGQHQCRTSFSRDDWDMGRQAKYKAFLHICLIFVLAYHTISTTPSIFIIHIFQLFVVCAAVLHKITE